MAFKAKLIASRRKPLEAFLPKEYKPSTRPDGKTPCIPFSHISGRFAPSFRETRVTPFGEDYQWPAQLKRCTAATADLQVDSCIRFDHRQAIHTLLQCRPTLQTSEARPPSRQRTGEHTSSSNVSASPSQASVFRIAESLTRSKGYQSSNVPVQRAYWCRLAPTFQPSGTSVPCIFAS